MRHLPRLVVLVFGLLFTPTLGLAQLDDFINPKDTVKDVIASFRAEMATLIAQAGTESRITLVRAFQVSDALINALSAAYAENLSVTFEELDKQQQKLFTDTRNVIKQVDAATATPLREATRSVNDATAVISDIAIWANKPMITAYFPSYIGPSSLVQDVNVTATGFRLQTTEGDEAKLLIGSQEYPSSQLTDVSLGFVIPRAAFATAKSGTAFQTATIVLSRTNGWWPWNSRQKVKFQLLFTVLPETLGSYTVSTKLRQPTTETKQFESDDLKVTKNGGGGLPLSECYSPPAGYKFDLSTVKVVETKHTAYKHDDTSPGTNIGYVKFKEDEITTPDRVCITVVASTGCKECGATTWGRLKATIVKTYDVETITESERKLLDWKSDAKIEIPKNAIDQTITVKLFDDLTRMGSPSSPPTIPFVDFDHDVRSTSVFLRPRQAWVAR